MKLNKYILYVVGMLLLFPVMNAAEPYLAGENNEIDQMVLVLQPTVYVIDGQMKRVKESEDATVVVANTKSFSQLTTDHDWFRNAKLLIITVAENQIASDVLNLEELKGFQKLQNVLVIYGFDACGNQSLECLEGLTDNMIKGHDDLTVFYQLSIPQ